ncbi:hypothetical protein [Bowmanella dokdonensis]|uniref:Uncharacterized protein n=1 Tax=Bowmanella dokdonensis TaxID=751969 RepID=A0A939DSY5_9ALTE|nr:hypothetical protein [Bowmanella dokdonensis]MBN7827361.1 hypothetical protein [Bowmanella dokdonensis]
MEVNLILRKYGVPPRGPYEPNATKNQMHKIWKLGFDPHETIQFLGKEQASILIDALTAQEQAAVEFHLLNIQRGSHKKKSIIFFTLLLLCTWVIVEWPAQGLFLIFPAITLVFLALGHFIAWFRLQMRLC